MQSSVGHYHHYRYLEWSEIIYLIYILEICCLVLHVPKSKGYLLTNFGGSTMKNDFVPTCQAMAHKIDI